jgi:predicted transcriptional regulator
VYREIPVAGSHVRSIISLFEANGFISREKKGRIKHISFTAKGKQIAEDVLKLKQDLNSPLSAFRNSL